MSQSKLDEVYEKIAEFVRTSVKLRDPNVPASGIIPVICHSSSVQKVDYALNEFIREIYLQMTQVSPRDVFKFESFALEECLLAFFNHSAKVPSISFDDRFVKKSIKLTTTIIHVLGV